VGEGDKPRTKNQKLISFEDQVESAAGGAALGDGGRLSMSSGKKTRNGVLKKKGSHCGEP